MLNSRTVLLFSKPTTVLTVRWTNEGNAMQSKYPKITMLNIWDNLQLCEESQLHMISKRGMDLSRGYSKIILSDYYNIFKNIVFELKSSLCLLQFQTTYNKRNNTSFLHHSINPSLSLLDNKLSLHLTWQQEIIWHWGIGVSAKWNIGTVNL